MMQEQPRADRTDLAAEIGAADDGWTPAYDMAPGAWRVLANDRSNVEIAYVAADPWPPERFFPRDGSKGAFRRFRSEAALTSFRDRLEREGCLVLDVAKAASGLVCRGPGEREDKPHGLFVAPPELARAWRAGAAEREVAARCEAILAGYKSWLRGEVFGLVRERLVVEDGRADAVDVRPDWLHLDEAGAKAALAALPDGPEPLPGCRP